jgi:hypothetical protein
MTDYKQQPWEIYYRPPGGGPWRVLAGETFATPAAAQVRRQQILRGGFAPEDVWILQQGRNQQ